MERNEEYTGEVLSLGSDGEGIINLDGTTVFVPFCLPEERVRFKVLKVDKRVAYGKLIEVCTPSEERVKPLCPNFTKCGGCVLQHMNYSAQLAFKRKSVADRLKKIGGIEAEVSPCVPCESGYGYRNKLAVPVGVDGDGETVFGFYAPRSHRIVAAESCPLQQKWSGTLIGALKEYMSAAELKGYDERTRRGDVRRLVAREVGGALIITVVAARRINLNPFADILQGVINNFTLWLNINVSQGNAVFGDEWRLCRGAGYFYGEDMGIKFKAGANTFLQVNDGVRAKLYEFAIKNACEKEAVAIDLYSGGGMLTALLAKGCKAAYGVEIIKEAVECADELKELNGLTDKMFNVCGAVEEKLYSVLDKTRGEKRVIVCDPPRKGMERSVVKAVAASGADKVVLISCDPATLARDLGLICGTLEEEEGALIKVQSPPAANYVIESVTPFDMFPQTKHVETVAVLRRS